MHYRFLFQQLGIFFGFFAVILFGEAAIAFAATKDISQVADNIIFSSQNLPGIVSIFAYMTGLILGVKGVLDIKQHVEAGHREMPMRTPIIEFICSGLLLALPYTYETLVAAFLGKGYTGVDSPMLIEGGSGNTVYAMFNGAAVALTTTTACSANYATELAGIFCKLYDHSASLPGLLSAFSYIAGLTFLYLAVINLKTSVENPGQNSLWKPFAMIVTAGMLLLFPYTVGAFITSLIGDETVNTHSEAGFTINPSGGDQTLDVVVNSFIFNIHGAAQFVMAGFCYLAGMILVMIGIFRMMKTMQDGARGPGGIGTIMTFLTGAALISVGPMMGALTYSLFGDSVSKTHVDLTLDGATEVYTKRMENFISGVLAYMIVVGWVAFVRGLFLVRGVAEGDQQASMMAAITHILGGAFLVNLGNFLNVIQATLGDIAGLPEIEFSS